VKEKTLESAVRELQRQMLLRHGLRVEPEMGKYLLRQLQQRGADATPLAMLGGDARTGMPMQMLIDPAALAASVSEPS